MSFKLDNDVTNRLYFAAKNMAVELAMKEISEWFRDLGMTVIATWKENSTSVKIELYLIPGKVSDAVRGVALARERMGNGPTSPFKHSVTHVQSGEYYDRRKPKSHEAFDSVLASKEFYALITKAVEGCNYPFSRRGFHSTV